MPRKISFINYKGGVGKTSLVVNVAASLAKMGKRVLIVDLDAQSNSSVWLLRVERWNPFNTQETGHLYSIFEPALCRLEDCIIRDVVRGKGGVEVLPDLDLLPTTFSLVDLEHEYESPNGLPAYMEFQEQLAEIEDEYDFIIFDCPPNVLSAARCGLFCSSEVYIPANPDALSLIGVGLLVEKLKQFQDESEQDRVDAGQPLAKIRGAILNSIKANASIVSPKMRLQFRLNQLKGYGPMAEDVKIFKAQIRDAVIVGRAVTLGLPVCVVGTRLEQDSVADDYMAVAEEILAIPEEIVSTGRVVADNAGDSFRL